MIKSIAVFCGSKSGLNLLFEEHAKQLGYLLAQQNITLIFSLLIKVKKGRCVNKLYLHTYVSILFIYIYRFSGTASPTTDQISVKFSAGTGFSARAKVAVIFAFVAIFVFR